MNIFFVLMLLAFLCFVLSAIGVATRINLTASGLMFMALAFALNAGLIA